MSSTTHETPFTFAQPIWRAARTSGLLATLLGTLATVFLSGPALAQEGGAPEKEPEPLPPIDLTPPFGAPEDPQAELKRLFGEVELHLRRIDELLWDASTGEDALGADVDSGISKLLESSRDNSRQASDSITRILQIAESQSSGGSSGGSLGPPPPPQQQGGDPGQEQRQDGELPQQPEGSKPEGEKPGEKPGGDEPKPGDQEQNTADANNAAGAPESGELSPVGHGDEAERWGELPLRVREVFRAEGSEEMPSRYRDWIDTYYRRLGQDR